MDQSNILSGNWGHEIERWSGMRLVSVDGMEDRQVSLLFGSVRVAIVSGRDRVTDLIKNRVQSHYMMYVLLVLKPNVVACDSFSFDRYSTLHSIQDC